MKCFFFGHKYKTFYTKHERLIRWGEKAPQYRQMPHIYCTECGKFVSAITGKMIGI